MWLAIASGPDEMHLIPDNDLIEHTPDEDCICGPTEHDLDQVGKMYAHASLDGREVNEPDWKG